MAKIGIQTWGSNGDIRPLLALGGGLQQAGHSVTLLVSSIDDRNYSDICQRLNIEYRHIPEAMHFDMPAFAQDTYKMNTIQWLLALLEAVFFPYEQEIYQASQQLAAENDVLIGHHFLYPLKIAAVKQDKPYITVTYCHGAIATKNLPPFKFPNLGAMLNRQQWKILNQTLDWALKKRLSKLWLAEGLPKFKHVYPSLLTSDVLNLVAVDPLLSPEGEEWSSIHQACGFLNLSERAETWSMPTGLQEFLASGDSPVYMTFGSLQQAVPEWSMELFVAATRLSGCRAIIQTSSEKYPADSQVGNIYFIGRHPHQPLFKQCAAVVHHGGAGTTHSVSRSGCPSVVVPFMDEQLFWGHKLQQAGLAGEPLPSHKADAETLAERINIVLSSKSMQLAAESVAQQMQGRNGVTEAVKLIEEVLK
jgi:UDP:flavonoid glycosyltransferase YjiC (YdhE family)